MNYKNIALIALLLPIASYSKSTEVRIKELKEFYEKKGLELLDIGEKIAERNDFVNSLRKDYYNKITDANQSALDLFASKFIKAVAQEKNINKFLTNELFNDTGNCDPMKVLLVRIMIQKSYIDFLVKKFEEYMQVLINTYEEITTLEK